MPPDESLTIPATLPYTACARAGPALAAKTNAASVIVTTVLKRSFVNRASVDRECGTSVMRHSSFHRPEGRQRREGQDRRDG